MISSRMQERLVKMAKKLVQHKHNQHESCGVACRWLKLAESWGIKFTELKHYLHDVFQNQLHGWQIGLAPYCFGFFEVNINGTTITGYITEIAVLACDYLRSKIGGDWWNYTEQLFGRQIRKVKRIITNQMGITPSDLHEHNWGFVNNKIVITDWGFDS